MKWKGKLFFPAFVFFLCELQLATTWECIKCTDCPVVFGNETTTNCLGCQIGKNEAGQIERGCNEYINNPVDIPCLSDKCNNKTARECIKCSTLDDCHKIVCNNITDDCYISTTDERRGCTSDGIFTDNENFEKCSPNNCNRVVHCVVCNSENPEHATCLENPEKFSRACEGHNLATIYANCYRLQDGDKFELGCTSESESSCEDVCKTCGADDCNASAFRTCYECSSSCRTVDLENKTACKTYDSPCLIAYNRSTEVTTRGCQDSLELGLDWEQLIVFNCSYSDCNNLEFPNHLKCYQSTLGKTDYCDSVNATHCFRYEVLRKSVFGCNTDAEYEKCNVYENCFLCDNDECNDGDQQNECIVCENEADCKNGTKKICENAKFYHGCYMYQNVTQGKLMKGCLSELTEENIEVYEACKENQASCQKCFGPYCNSMHCLSCDSRNGSECVAGVGSVPYDLCQTTDKCRMFVDEKYFTLRGCSSKFEDQCSDDTHCKEIEEPAGNEGLYPSDAIKCYQCSKNCNTAKPEDLNYCIVNRVAGCYYIFKDFEVTSRGCLSEKITDCEKNPLCQSCDYDNCNSDKPWTCYDCVVTEEYDCLDDTSKTCLTAFNCTIYSDGDTVKRTCIDSKTVCDLDPNKCKHSCKGDQCNENDICANTCSGQFGIEICSLKNLGEKCFRYQNQDQCQLGCYGNLTENCSKDENHCYICDTSLCNKAERAECFVCSSNCFTIDSVETQFCQDSTDKCFTERDENGEVIRGCTSGEQHYDNECSIPACNREVVYKSCYKCENCTDIVNLEPKACTDWTFQGCYTLQNLSTGEVQRGCIPDDEFQSCRENINCKTCEHENCNRHEVINEALMCSSCTGSNCFYFTPAEPCKRSVGLLIDSCVTLTIYNLTVRKGCLSDIPLNELDSYCNDKSENCALCNENFCNTPELSCFKCSTPENGIECIIDPSNKTSCNGNGVCVTFVNSTGHLYRGCLNDFENPCNQGSHCKQCKEHECNTDILPENRISCYQCEGQGCKASELSNTKPCLIYEESQTCYTYVQDESSIYRGCSNDYSANCEENFCKLSDCNNQSEWQHNPLSCIQCSKNSECEGQAFGNICTKPLLLGREDSCYTLYYGNLTIQKGCLSEITSNQCKLEDASCKTCSGNDCNAGSALCYTCNSFEDADCSELVSVNHYVQECKSECVTLIDNNGYTERGCIEDFSIKCNEKDVCKNVESCKGKLCNDKILPKGRHRCFICQGPECIDPIALLNKTCPIYKSGDECYTRVVNSTWVERDCLSSRPEDCHDDCVRCEKSGCNAHQLYELNNLSCITCEGEKCNGIVNGVKCSTQLLLGRKDYCYEYMKGEIVSKGCLSDLDQSNEIREACEATGKPSVCTLCDKNDCNGDFFQCVSCDSAKYSNCGGRMDIVPTDKLNTCDQRKCISYIDNNGITYKGCSNASYECKPDDVTCNECDRSMCNNILFPVDRIRCYQCSNCKNATSGNTLDACSKYTPEDFCYTDIIDNSTSRGCLSDLPPGSTEPFLKCNTTGCNNHPYEYNSSLTCIQCQGSRECQSASTAELCEGKIVLGFVDQCYSLLVNGEFIQKGCQRSFPSCSGEDCQLCSCNGCNLATMPSNISCIECTGEDCYDDKHISKISENTACISYVSEDGIVSRGFLKDFERLCSTYGSKHETCFENNCNKGMFPPDRIMCHRCEECDTVVQSPEICPKYVEADGCFTHISNVDSTVSRGCISELVEICNKPLCNACYISGCNDADMIVTTEYPDSTTIEHSSTITSVMTSTNEASMTTSQGDGTTIRPPPSTTVTSPSSQNCIICNELRNVACAWGFQPDVAAKCPSDAETGCFTCKQEDNYIVRGCLSEQEQSQCADNSTEECSDSGCNNANQRSQRCAVCDSNCDGPNASYQVERCAGIIEYANRGCYLIRNERRIVIERGCLSTLDDEKKRDCNTFKEKCVICYNDGCNTAMVIGIIKSLLVLTFVVTILRSKLLELL